MIQRLVDNEANLQASVDPTTSRRKSAKVLALVEYRFVERCIEIIRLCEGQRIRVKGEDSRQSNL